MQSSLNFPDKRPALKKAEKGKENNGDTEADCGRDYNPHRAGQKQDKADNAENAVCRKIHL